MAFIYVITCTNTFVIFTAVYIWIYHNLFYHSTAIGHLDCLQFCAITNEAAKSILIQVFLGGACVLIHLEYTQGVYTSGYPRLSVRVQQKPCTRMLITVLLMKE